MKRKLFLLFLCLFAIASCNLFEEEENEEDYSAVISVIDQMIPYITTSTTKTKTVGDFKVKLSSHVITITNSVSDYSYYDLCSKLKSRYSTNIKVGTIIATSSGISIFRNIYY